MSSEFKFNMSLEKSKIINPRTEFALFLGTLIKISNNHVGATKGNTHSLIGSKLRMLAPLDRIFNKLVATGFISAQYKSGIPRFL
jgi:hypothetical protein